MRCTARCNNDSFRTEDEEITCTNIEADGARDTVFLLLVHQQVRHHDPVVNLGRRLACRLRDDGLIALAVDHDLPLSFALVTTSFRIAHHWQTPLVKLMYGGIDVPSDVVAEVFTYETHKVVPGVAHVILGLILVPLHAHVGIDGVQPLGDRTTALDVRLLYTNDFQVSAPVTRFISGSATCHAPADDEDVRIDELRFSSREQAHQRNPLPRLSIESAGNPPSMLSASGSCASSSLAKSSSVGAS